MTKFDRYEE